ncbi:hypothetical protein BsWGS_19138 [Bradybaena similaris]
MGLPLISAILPGQTAEPQITEITTSRLRASWAAVLPLYVGASRIVARGFGEEIHRFKSANIGNAGTQRRRNGGGQWLLVRRTRMEL